MQRDRIESPEAIEVMSSRLETIRLDAKLPEAYARMRSLRIRHLPVVNDAGRIIGMLSDRDLQRAMAPKPAPQDPGAEPHPDFDPAHEVRHFMSWPAKTVGLHESVRQVASWMLEEKVSAYVVTAERQRAVGIVTTDDLLFLLISLLRKEPKHGDRPLKSIFEDFNVPTGTVF